MFDSWEEAILYRQELEEEEWYDENEQVQEVYNPVLLRMLSTGGSGGS